MKALFAFIVSARTEIFFSTDNQLQDLEKGCQSWNFDAFIAHTTIVMANYLEKSEDTWRNPDPDRKHTV
jgi:hypothetical protein